MKKNLTIGLLIASFFCYSQTIDHALLEVMYHYEFVVNRLEPQNRSTDEVILLIGSIYTGYFSFRNHIADSLVRTGGAEYRPRIMGSDGRPLDIRAGETFEDAARRAGISGTPNVIMPRTMPARSPFNRARYFINRESARATCMALVTDMRNPSNVHGHRISYAEILQSPVWRISTETQTIIGYRSQKATTRFGGRDWTVWFTPDIPISEGPWKLRGLPGLILKAYTADGEFSLMATSVSRGTNRPIVMDENNVYIDMPKRDFFRLKTEGMRNHVRPFEFNHIEILE